MTLNHSFRAKIFVDRLRKSVYHCISSCLLQCAAGVCSISIFVPVVKFLNSGAVARIPETSPGKLTSHGRRLSGQPVMGCILLSRSFEQVSGLEMIGLFSKDKGHGQQAAEQVEGHVDQDAEFYIALPENYADEGQHEEELGDPVIGLP